MGDRRRGWRPDGYRGQGAGDRQPAGYPGFQRRQLSGAASGPHFVDELALALPHYGKRAAVRPGITGWAQINYPYGASVEDVREKLAYDLYYGKNRGILLDILILFSTVRVIVFREAAR